MSKPQPPQPCGFFCYPAMDGDLLATLTLECHHDESAHYSIDGEATGCMACDDLLEPAG